MYPLDFSILCICPLWVVNMSNIGVILSDVSKKCAVWMVNMSNITGIFMMSVYMCSVDGKLLLRRSKGYFSIKGLRIFFYLA